MSLSQSRQASHTPASSISRSRDRNATSGGSMSRFRRLNGTPTGSMSRSRLMLRVAAQKGKQEADASRAKTPINMGSRSRAGSRRRLKPSEGSRSRDIIRQGETAIEIRFEQDIQMGITLRQQSGDVFISYVKLSRGQAKKLGVRVGDRIVNINGTPLRALSPSETGPQLTRRVTSMPLPMTMTLARLNHGNQHVTVADGVRERLQGRRTMARVLTVARAEYEKRRGSTTPTKPCAPKFQRRNDTDRSPIGVSDLSVYESTVPQNVRTAKVERFVEPERVAELMRIKGRIAMSSEGTAAKLAWGERQEKGETSTIAQSPSMELIRSRVQPKRYVEDRRIAEYAMINQRNIMSQTLADARAEYESRPKSTIAQGLSKRFQTDRTAKVERFVEPERVAALLRIKGRIAMSSEGTAAKLAWGERQEKGETSTIAQSPSMELIRSRVQPKRYVEDRRIAEYAMINQRNIMSQTLADARLEWTNVQASKQGQNITVAQTPTMELRKLALKRDPSTDDSQQAVQVWVEPAVVLEQQLRAGRETMSQELTKANGEYNRRLEKQSRHTTIARGPSMERRCHSLQRAERFLEDQRITSHRDRNGRSYMSQTLADARSEWESRPRSATVAIGPSSLERKPSEIKKRYLEDSRIAELTRINTRKLMHSTLANARLEWESRPRSATVAIGPSSLERKPSEIKERYLEDRRIAELTRINTRKLMHSTLNAAKEEWSRRSGPTVPKGPSFWKSKKPFPVNTTTAEVSNGYDVHRRKEMSDMGRAHASLYHSRVPRGMGTQI